MSIYPIEKYRYYQTKTKSGQDRIIAVTTYAGKTVRGVAICHENDTFSLETGKKIAAARCAVKVAELRLKRAERKRNKADTLAWTVQDYFDMMVYYQNDAEDALEEARNFLCDVMDKI